MRALLPHVADEVPVRGLASSEEPPPVEGFGAGPVTWGIQVAPGCATHVPFLWEFPGNGVQALRLHVRPLK